MIAAALPQLHRTPNSWLEIVSSPLMTFVTRIQHCRISNKPHVIHSNRVQMRGDYAAIKKNVKKRVQVGFSSFMTKRFFFPVYFYTCANEFRTHTHTHIYTHTYARTKTATKAHYGYMSHGPTVMD